MIDIDLFYTIIQELDFFDNFFSFQYLINLEKKTVKNIKKNQFISFDLFIKKNKLTHFLDTTCDLITTPNNIIVISPKNYPNYKLVLKINTSLSYFEHHSTLLLNNNFIPLNNITTLKKLTTQINNKNIHIIIFSFYTNQNLSDEEINNTINILIKQTFKNEHSYFLHLEYNKYCLVIKNSTELKLYRTCLNMYESFYKTKNIYLIPKFFLTEYNQNIEFSCFIKKIKQHFNTLSFDKNTIIIKERIK